MKAEHRKELQTNVLADSMGRLLKAIKSGSNTIFYGFLGLIVLGFGLYWGIGYFTTNAEQKKSKLWRDLDSAEKPDDLNKIIENNPKTTQARMARFEKARTLMQQGSQLFSPKVGLTDKSLESLSHAEVPEPVMAKLREMKDQEFDDLEHFTAKLALTLSNKAYFPAQFVLFNGSPLTKLLWCADYIRAKLTREELLNKYQKLVVSQVGHIERMNAKEDLAQARDIYDALGDVCSDDPVLAQEALGASATIRESLNDVDGAKQCYEKLVKLYPNSAAGKAAAAALAEWTDRAEKTREIYKLAENVQKH